MDNKNKTLCYTGHRKLPSGQKRVKLEQNIEKSIKEAIKDGYDTFLFGGAVGFDNLCAFIIAKNKQIYPQIKLIAVVPFLGHQDKWSEQEKSQYHSLIYKCDDIIILSKEFHQNCYRDRNRYMISSSSRVIAYYNGQHRSGTGMTVRMAMQENLEVINLY